MRTSIRAMIAAGAIAALAPFGALPVEAAATAEKAMIVESPALVTPVDWAINVAVARMTEAQKLSPADARIAREQLQMQFRSLSAAAQKSIMDVAATTTGENAVERMMMMLQGAVASNARRALAATQAKSQTERMRPELGPPPSPDLTFVPTEGPCRVYDSRNAPGILGPGVSRQIWGFSSSAGYLWATSQGGTGSAGSGNCTGTVYSGSAVPISVVATVTVVNPTTSGALRAWNGGTVLTTGAIHAWNAGDQHSNTTVIPMDRFITAYPSSGPKRDIGINNNSGGNVHVIIDVVGYFIENTATALDCYTESGALTPIPNGVNTAVAAPFCDSGYTNVSALPWVFISNFGVWVTFVSPTGCRFGNNSGGSVNVYCDMRCCRVPGR